MLKQGFAIGNGLTDPAVQYKAYPDYALDMGIIKKSEHARISKIIPVCEMAIKLCGNVTFEIVLSFLFLLILILPKIDYVLMFYPLHLVLFLILCTDF